MDGEHSSHDIDECYRVTEWTLRSVFRELYDARVDLEGIVLKPNMVISARNALDRRAPRKLPKRPSSV